MTAFIDQLDADFNGKISLREFKTTLMNRNGIPLFMSSTDDAMAALLAEVKKEALARTARGEAYTTEVVANTLYRIFDSVGLGDISTEEVINTSTASLPFSKGCL